jgi:hypothetical protein
VEVLVELCGNSCGCGDFCENSRKRPCEISCEGLGAIGRKGTLELDMVKVITSAEILVEHVDVSAIIKLIRGEHQFISIGLIDH